MNLRWIRVHFYFWGAFLALACLLSSCSSEKSDMNRRISALQKVAEDGDSEAQYELALLLAEGKAVPQDVKTSVAWLKKAAEKGHSEAQKQLGDAYAQGRGVEKDPDQAIKWYQMFANQKIAESQPATSLPKVAPITSFENSSQKNTPAISHSTATPVTSSNPPTKEQVLYDLGLYQLIQNNEIIRNPGKAVENFRKGAQAGDALSQANLGIMIAEGQGAPQDMVDGLAWIYLAQAQGNVRVAKPVASLEQALGPEGITKARQRMQQLSSEISNP
jgi:uncharacterized protein